VSILISVVITIVWVWFRDLDDGSDHEDGKMRTKLSTEEK